MESVLDTVTKTQQNVYDELKVKKTPGDSWFGFGFAFFWDQVISQLHISEAVVVM